MDYNCIYIYSGVNDLDFESHYKVKSIFKTPAGDIHPDPDPDYYLFTLRNNEIPCPFFGRIVKYNKPLLNSTKQIALCLNSANLSQSMVIVTKIY